ncbi:response regulator transcription factor [Aestuariispira insulae]|uniref:Response regulator receiver domain-containing protein n=1 Tax=Aestuariispira insulae TaxID=1461337 RepID=A0A3D9HPG9_9PROT|nr:response regulator [Aestuariispira insulae]RED50796.1 response regulator receiver domain-containing protein [Aestuariispira insulae]
MSHSVLVVEDEPNIVLSLQFIMKQAGFAVRVAEDGDKAVREVTRKVPDIVLLDIMLPKTDGFTVCETIKSDPRCKKVKIIMLSAKSRDADREKALALGADDFITKPFSTRELGDRVRQLLGLTTDSAQAS